MNDNASRRSTRQETERECVRRLLATLGRPAARLDTPNPPAPDVRAGFADGSAEAFEVTEIHPDESPGHGSAARAAEEERTKRDPNVIASSWIRTDTMPAIRYRLEQKIKKAAGYAVQSNEPLSVLLIGSLPKIGAVAATYVLAAFLTVEQLNMETHQLLEKSRFQNAYVYLPLSDNALFGWNRATSWRVLREPADHSLEGRQTLEMLKSQGNFGRSGLLPGTKLFGRWP